MPAFRVWIDFGDRVPVALPVAYPRPPMVPRHVEKGTDGEYRELKPRRLATPLPSGVSAGGEAAGPCDREGRPPMSSLSEQPRRMAVPLRAKGFPNSEIPVRSLHDFGRDPDSALHAILRQDPAARLRGS